MTRPGPWWSAASGCSGRPTGCSTTSRWSSSAAGACCSTTGTAATTWTPTTTWSRSATPIPGSPRPSRPSSARSARTPATCSRASWTTPRTCWVPTRAGSGRPGRPCSPAPGPKPTTWPCGWPGTTPAAGASSSPPRPTTATPTWSRASHRRWGRARRSTPGSGGSRPRTPTAGPPPAWAPGVPGRSQPRSVTWLGPVAEVVRQAGGLFVADEVQSGFARSGERMWGYQRHGLDPDLVTMGKPMGNGYPVAGVLVVPEVVAGFGRDTRYFNTFGGNTVAVAAAQVTLDVIRDEDLLARSGRVGAFLRAELTGLAARYPVIGDVRGSGLYLGVELVRDAGTKEPDPAASTAVVNGLRQRRVLISATGEHGNVLKIRPPLVFAEADATRLLTELDAVLASQPA